MQSLHPQTPPSFFTSIYLRGLREHSLADTHMWGQRTAVGSLLPPCGSQKPIYMVRLHSKHFHPVCHLSSTCSRFWGVFFVCFSSFLHLPPNTVSLYDPGKPHQKRFCLSLPALELHHSTFSGRASRSTQIKTKIRKWAVGRDFGHCCKPDVFLKPLPLRLRGLCRRGVRKVVSAGGGGWLQGNRIF